MGKQLEEQPTFHSVDEFYDIQRAENVRLTDFFSTLLSL